MFGVLEDLNPLELVKRDYDKVGLASFRLTSPMLPGFRSQRYVGALGRVRGLFFHSIMGLSKIGISAILCPVQRLLLDLSLTFHRRFAHSIYIIHAPPRAVRACLIDNFTIPPPSPLLYIHSSTQA